MNNILIVNAHPDDAELMAGGSMLKWKKHGANIFVLTFSDGGLTLPDGSVYRSKEDAIKEEKLVSNYIGYTCENLGIKNLHLEFKDEYVVKVIENINKYKIDTIITHYDKDLHHDHEIA